MPSLDEVKAFRVKLFEKSMALVDKKGHDYNAEQQEAGDTLFNLTVCEILGVVPSTEAGILVRLSDKLMRLISLTKPGREAQVKDESVLDTIADIHNYSDYLGLIWQQRRNPVALTGQGRALGSLDIAAQQRKDLEEKLHQIERVPNYTRYVKHPDNG